MSLKNETIKNTHFLADMYDDAYFPNFLVDKIKSILIDLCIKIETEKPKTNQLLLTFTQAATEKINDLEKVFEDNNSELETAARDAIAHNFELIVRAYGFKNIDIEDVIAPRNW